MMLPDPYQDAPCVPPRTIERPGPVRLFRRPRIWRFIALLAALTLLLLAFPALAAATRPALCDAAAREASDNTGVPLSVLQAVMLTETGRKRDGKMQPWPWTVNVAGKGVWFETADDARAYAYQQLKAGEQSFDVGCFQVNYKWHGDEFASLEDMMNPRINAEYAASFLARLFAEKGTWGDAVGAYHSRTPEKSEAYLAKFNRFHAALRGSDPAPPDADRLTATAADSAPRLNTYPLLVQRETGAAMGSLVPVGPAVMGASLFSPAGGL